VYNFDDASDTRIALVDMQRHSLVRRKRRAYVVDPDGVIYTITTNAGGEKCRTLFDKQIFSSIIKSPFCPFS
jgi:S-adenosylmethionine hydrolase